MKWLLFCFLFSPIALIAQTNYPESNNVISNIIFKVTQDSIVAKIKRKDITSFAVAVSQNGKVIWQQAFGWANKEKKIKATPTTSYALASLSKSITCTAIMILSEKGLIHLDDPVAKYLGNATLTYFKGSSDELTTSHLMNMAGGIPHQWEYYYTDEKKQFLPIEEQIKRYGIVVFPLTQVFNYSNFSIAILEQIIKQATHKDLSQFMSATIFNPLHMKNAAVNRGNLLSSAIARGYDNDGHLLAESEFYPKAGAGYFASAADLIRYGMFHLKEKKTELTPILSNENIDILHLPKSYTPHNAFYANGWGVLKIGSDKTSLLSNGAIDGTATSLLLLPEKNIAIVCLTNATVGNDFTDQMAFTIANILVPGYSAEVDSFFNTNAPAFADKPFEASDSLVGTWEGKIVTYKDSIPLQIVFETSNKIYVHIQGQFETLMNNTTINSGLIVGQCFGNISLPETEGIPHYLEFVLKQDRDEIFGSISAQSAFSKRPRFLIPAYLSLKRKK